jgi:hypothetical protein
MGSSLRDLPHWEIYKYTRARYQIWPTFAT